METDAERKAAMINALEYCTISKACEAQGVGRSTFYRWRQEDPQFASDVQTALSARGMDDEADEVVERSPAPDEGEFTVPAGVVPGNFQPVAQPPADVPPAPAAVDAPPTDLLEDLRQRVTALEAAVELLSGDFVTPKLAQKFRELRDKLQGDYAARRNLQAYFQQMQGASTGLLTGVLDAFIDQDGRGQEYAREP